MVTQCPDESNSTGVSQPSSKRRVVGGQKGLFVDSLPVKGTVQLAVAGDQRLPCGTYSPASSPQVPTSGALGFGGGGW